MKSGDRVKYTPTGRTGTCRGPVLHFTVMWMIVDWDDGMPAYVLEEYLETIPSVQQNNTNGII